MRKGAGPGSGHALGPTNPEGLASCARAASFICHRSLLARCAGPAPTSQPNSVTSPANRSPACCLSCSPCSTTGLPAGVDALVPLLFNIQDEGSSPLLDQNMAAANLSVAATFDPAWGESNLMHSINGEPGGWLVGAPCCTLP